MADRELAGRRLLAVTEEELQRIVLDIHDGPVQNIFAALSQLALVRRHVAANAQVEDACGAGLANARQLLEASLDAIRNVLTTFHAPEFAASSLVDIVEGLVVEHETVASQRMTLEIEGTVPDVPLVIKIALYRVLQEALSNIRRHSEARAATVRVAVRDGRVRLEIDDDGRGFSPPPLVGPKATENPVHIGLRGMRERAAMLNGELAVESGPGKGTRVRVEIPLDA